MNSSSSGKENRRYKRNKLQRVIVIINDQPYLAKNWSPDGFAIQCEDQELEPGSYVRGSLDIYDVEDTGEFRARIIRQDDDNIVACQFIELSAHIFMNLCMTVDMNEDGQYGDASAENG